MTTRDDMTLSVVIPIFNASRTLKACLNGLMQLEQSEDVPVILVDNGSTDTSAEIVESFIDTHPHHDMRLLNAPTPGAGAARNRGCREAKSDWVVFTDADCIPSSSWIRDLRAAIAETPEMGAIAGCIQSAAASGIVARFLGLCTLPPTPRDMTFTTFEPNGRGGFPTANLAVRKDVFEAIGGFDEARKIYGEDHDLCRRIYANGGIIRALTSAVVYHIHRDSVHAMMRQARGFGEAHAWKLRTHQEGCLILAAPGIDICRGNSRWRVWVDLNQADKKLGGVILAGCLWWPLFALLPIYVVYLSMCMATRMRTRGLRVRVSDVIIMPWLMALKSAAMTSGRIAGSIRNRVFCI